MNYMLVYVDSYNRDKRNRFFDTEHEMRSFVLRDEVHTVIGLYKLEKI